MMNITMNEQEKKFVCNLCKMNFSLEKSLKRHKQILHNMIYPRQKSSKNNEHKCTQCECAFIAKNSLQRHVKLKHSIVPPPVLKKPKSLKCVMFEPLLSETDHVLLKNILPENYIYKVCNVKYWENNKFTARFEIADLDSDLAFLNWIETLSAKSNVTYKVKSYNQSISKNNIFNKAYRCVHNTYPSRLSTPHPKHTNCPASLTVRIIKCREARYLKNTISNNSIMLISHKAIIILKHCHNHIIEGNLLGERSLKKKKQRDRIGTSVNNLSATTENRLNKVLSDESNSQSTLTSSSLVPFYNGENIKNIAGMFEKTLYKSDTHYTIDNNPNVSSGTYLNNLTTENNLNKVLSDESNSQSTLSSSSLVPFYNDVSIENIVGMFEETQYKSDTHYTIDNNQNVSSGTYLNNLTTENNLNEVLSDESNSQSTLSSSSLVLFYNDANIENIVEMFEETQYKSDTNYTIDNNQNVSSGTYLNNLTTENNLNEVLSDESNSQSTLSSSSLVPFYNDALNKNKEEVSYESKYDRYHINVGIQSVSSENELSDEVDNSNEYELYELLSDYDNLHKSMKEKFESNPCYFTSAIRECSLAIKMSLSSETSSLNAQCSFENK